MDFSIPSYLWNGHNFWSAVLCFWVIRLFVVHIPWYESSTHVICDSLAGHSRETTSPLVTHPALVLSQHTCCRNVLPMFQTRAKCHKKRKKMYVHGHKQINCIFVIIYKLIIWLIIFLAASSFKWNLVISLSDGHSKNKWEITPKTTERDKEKLIENSVSGWVLLQLVKPV